MDSQSPPRRQLLAVGGSYRRGGNTDVLLRSFVAGVESAGAVVETVSLRDLSFSSCVGCELCADSHECRRFADDLTPLYTVIEEADGLILASPTYNYNVTALMKAFIDRLYPFYEFGDEHPRPFTSHLTASPPRRAAVIAVCEQVSDEDLGFTVEGMARPLRALGYDVREEVVAYGFFESGAVGRDERLLEDVTARGRRFA